MKKTVKLSGKDIKTMVDKIVAESKKRPINELVGLLDDEPQTNQTGRGAIRRNVNDPMDWKNKYARGTKWCRDGVVENYGPITVFISDDRQTKIAMDKNGSFYSSDNKVISKEEAESLLGCSLSSIQEQISRKKSNKTIRLTESEMIEFLDRLASKVENGKRRRSIK